MTGSSGTCGIASVTDELERTTTMTDTRTTAMTVESQIHALVETMTLPDKVRLLSGADTFSLHGDDRIGLDPIIMSDGPTGVRGEVVVGGRISCLLPNASLLAQSWSLDALREVGDLLAEEAIDQQTHVVLGPTINLHRSPLGGRLFEAFSEDPLLTGLLAAAYVRGLQQRGIAATPKHFLGNESETQRTTVNAVISPEGLREAYLLPFQIVVEDARPWALMAAYNRVNGVPSTEHDDLINGIVKGEWGFDGVMMSDWLATQSTVESATGGLDLVMPGPDTPWNDSLVHHYHFRLYALDVEHLKLADGFTVSELRAAMDGHVLAEAELMGTYTLNPALA